MERSVWLFAVFIKQCALAQAEALHDEAEEKLALRYGIHRLHKKEEKLVRDVQLNDTLPVCGA